MTISGTTKRMHRSTTGDDAEALASMIRARIIAGEYGPDQRLVESELATALGASRAAVRGALLVLANEGLVGRNRYRGARVRVVSVAEAVEITEVRMVVEGLCARRAAEQVSAVDVASLRDLGGRMRDAVRSGDLAGYSELNQVLHRSIIEISGQAAAAAELERLHAQSVRHEFRLALVPGRVQVSLGEHERIIDAICAQDLAAAEAAMRAHLASVVEALKRTRIAPVWRSSEPGGPA